MVHLSTKNRTDLRCCMRKVKSEQVDLDEEFKTEYFSFSTTKLATFNFAI